jgi:hypothetical protein
MSKKFVFLIIGFFFCLPSAFSQSNSRNASAIFLELGGNGGITSLNYDRRFQPGTGGFGGRIGIGIGEGRLGHIFPELVPTIPLAINYLTGEGSHHLEVGAGVTIATSELKRDPKSVFFVPSLGYRLQSPVRRFSFRAFVSPFIASKVNISGGLSFGICF